MGCKGKHEKGGNASTASPDSGSFSCWLWTFDIKDIKRYESQKEERCRGWPLSITVKDAASKQLITFWPTKVLLYNILNVRSCCCTNDKKKNIIDPHSTERCSASCILDWTSQLRDGFWPLLAGSAFTAERQRQAVPVLKGFQVGNRYETSTEVDHRCLA